MAPTTVFKRWELKYLLTREQQGRVLAAMAPHMALDRYGRTGISSLYFDTESFRLIRRSLEKPVYKEKLRLRSYGTATERSPVFAELKKKYKHIVYKRRIALTEPEAMAWLCGRSPCPTDSQISREIDYFMEHYRPLRPTVLLSCQREAYASRVPSDLRITFDEHILCQRERLTLRQEPSGIPLLPEDQVLMEIKCSGGLPLWLTEVLSREKIYRTSFSKYGTAYRTLIYPEIYGGHHHA